MKATSKFVFISFFFFLVFLCKKHILCMRVCARARLCYFITATSSHAFSTWFVGGFMFVCFVSMMCFGEEWDATKVEVGRNGKFKWTFIPLLWSTTPTPYPMAPLSPSSDRRAAQERKKSNFEALSDESEGELADKREFYCFFVHVEGRGVRGA